MHQLRLRRTVIVAVLVAAATMTSACSTTSPTAAGASATGHSVRSPDCRAAALSLTVSGRDGTALPAPPTDEGAVLLAVVVTNEGTHSCVLGGWPRARLSAHGEPFGPYALQIRAVPAPAVTLRPSGAAQVYTALHARTDSAHCDAVVPDAVAEVLPHTERPLSAGLPPGYLGSTCRSETDTLIGIQAVLPR